MGEHIPIPPQHPLPPPHHHGHGHGHPHIRPISVHPVPIHHQHPIWESEPIFEERKPRRRSHRHDEPAVIWDYVDEGHDMGHANKDKKDKKKDEESWPMPLKKPGTIVEYESWGFRKIGETWGKADRYQLEVPRAHLADQVKAQMKAGGEASIYKQMSSMNNLRAEQINRLIRARQDAEKNPYYEWQCRHIAAKKGNKNKEGKREYPAMDVILVKIVKKREEFTTEPEQSGPVLAGDLVDLSKPEKKEKKDKKKKKEEGEHPVEFFDDPAILGGEPVIVPDLGDGQHPDVYPVEPFDEGGHYHNRQPQYHQEIPHYHREAPHHHYQNPQYHPEIHPYRHEHPPYHHDIPPHHNEPVPQPLWGEQVPRAPSVPPARRSRSRHRHRVPDAHLEPILVDTRQEIRHVQPIDSSLDEDEVSVWFGGDDRSSRTSHSGGGGDGIDFMKKLPLRRGSLKRNSREQRKSYREHRRQDSYGKYSDETVDIIPERARRRPEGERRLEIESSPFMERERDRDRDRRPDIERRRTLSYVPLHRATDIIQSDRAYTPTHRSYSPPPSIDRDRYDQFTLDDLMREVDLLDREEHLQKRERQVELEEERRRRDLIQEIERRNRGRRGRGYNR